MTNDELINIAKRIRKNAYSPLTGYSVGVALLAKSGTVYVGANIDDKTIPNLSTCAERVAFQSAMSYGEREFEKIAVVGGKSKADVLDNVVPCGICLQYMLDNCENIKIVVNIDGEICEKKLIDFLNSPFKL